MYWIENLYPWDWRITSRSPERMERVDLDGVKQGQEFFSLLSLIVVVRSEEVSFYWNHDALLFLLSLSSIALVDTRQYVHFSTGFA